MTSLRGVTGARDHNIESSHSDLSIKFCKLFLRVAVNTGKSLQESKTCTFITLYFFFALVSCTLNASWLHVAVTNSKA